MSGETLIETLRDTTKTASDRALADLLEVEWSEVSRVRHDKRIPPGFLLQVLRKTNFSIHQVDKLIKGK